jgi:glycosyltransferase involved in cell wall biosynthesis
MLTNWPHRAVLRAFQRCLLAIVPSVWPEPCPTVLLEAMAAGRAVVASSVGGIPELVVDGETGLLVPPGDAAALRHALQRMLDDPTLRRRMGAAGRKRVEQFRGDRVVPRIERVYQQVRLRQRCAA